MFFPKPLLANNGASHANARLRVPTSAWMSTATGRFELKFRKIASFPIVCQRCIMLMLRR